MAEVRNPEFLRRQIAAERDELTSALEELRKETTDVRRRMGSKLKVIVPAALAGLFLLFTGLTATLRFITRRVRR